MCELVLIGNQCGCAANTRSHRKKNCKIADPFEPLITLPFRISPQPLGVQCAGRLAPERENPTSPAERLPLSGRWVPQVSCCVNADCRGTSACAAAFPPWIGLTFFHPSLFCSPQTIPVTELGQKQISTGDTHSFFLENLETPLGECSRNQG